jgi:4-nitrophenyl phosphatase
VNEPGRAAATGNRRGSSESVAKQGNLVCDLDGVVYIGGRPVPGAGRALTEIHGAGVRVVFATNAAIRTPAEVAERIERITGFTVDPDRVVTSAVAAASMIIPADLPVLVVGESGLVDTLADAGVAVTGDPAEARCVVVGLDRGFDYARLRGAAAAVRAGARLLATNTDATFPTQAGLWPGAGSLVAAVETAAGARAEVAGKPHEPMLTAIAGLLGPGPTWLVGDRPETDLALAACAGWTRVLVLTGVVKDPTDIEAALAPHHVLDTISDLPALLDQTE